MADIETYDFFSQGKADFYSKFSHESILCQGKHWEKPPLVTILLTTYKRPEFLKRALESALNQEGFEDYQIIVVDNEGVPIEEETSTSRVLMNYQHEKVIYYRHSQEVSYKADSAVRLAKSPWIVFLHDDDILSKNHLAVMTGIIKKHREIRFLGCSVTDFTSERDIENEINEKNVICKYKIRKQLKSATCLGGWASWLGALIDRECYIAMGGMPALSMGCGDKVMVGIFLSRYGTYRCDPSKPLYYYRKGEQQSCYTQKSQWERILMNEYFFERYAINKYHKFTHKIWERNLAYYILPRCIAYQKIYSIQINLDEVITKCNMPADVKEKNFLYYATKAVFWLYRYSVLGWGFFYMQILKRSEIRLEV